MHFTLAAHTQKTIPLCCGHPITPIHSLQASTQETQSLYGLQPPYFLFLNMHMYFPDNEEERKELLYTQVLEITLKMDEQNERDSDLSAISQPRHSRYRNHSPMFHHLVTNQDEWQ